MNKEKIVKRALFGLLTAGVVILAVILILPPILGWSNLVVMTDSMEPTFKQGDMICIKPCSMDEVQIGDIITFEDRHGTYTTHRVICISDDSFTTKGDANIDYDAFLVDEDHLVGKVLYHIPFIGKPIAFFHK